MSSKATSASCNDEQRKILIECMRDEALRGGYSDNGFKSTAWKTMTSSFNLKKGSPDYSTVQLHSQYAYLKKKYSVFKELKSNSGFGWDEELNIPTAPNEVWDAYIKSHPLAKEFRAKTLFFDEITDIFEGRIANGNMSLSSTTDLSTPSSKVSSVVNSFENSCSSVSNDDKASYSGNERKKRRTTEREDVASLLKEIIKGQEKNRPL